jgi:hypothetical protein
VVTERKEKPVRRHPFIPPRIALATGLVAGSLLIASGARADLINTMTMHDTPTDFFGKTDDTVAAFGLTIWGSAFWDVRATQDDFQFFGFGAPDDIKITATHLVAPHGPPEAAPNPNTLECIIFNVVPGTPLAPIPPTTCSDMVTHPLLDGHNDHLFATYAGIPAAFPATSRLEVYLWHTPEPSSALLIGLIGLTLLVARRPRIPGAGPA